MLSHDDLSPGAVHLKNGSDDPVLAYKVCVARELYEETGIDLRGSLDRLQPIHLRPTGHNKFPCEYKKRIFFSAEIFDDDVSLQEKVPVFASSLTQALDKTPPHAMVRYLVDICWFYKKSSTNYFLFCS